MADPIKHGVLSATATTGWETTKGVIKAGLLIVGAPAVVVAAGALMAGVGLTAALMLGVVTGGAFGGLATAAAVAGGWTVPAILGIGGAMGLLKGTRRVGIENAAFEAKVRKPDVNAASLQQSYMMGAQDMQQQMVAQLQQAQYAAIQQEMTNQQSKNIAAGQPVGAFSKRAVDGRAAPAQQLG